MKSRLIPLAAAAAAAAMVLSACSSSSSGGNSGTGGASTPAAGSSAPAGSSAAPASSGGSSAAGGSGLAAAAARVAAALKIPTTVGVTAPLTKKAPTGKNIYYLQCGVGICTQIGAELDNAAKLLGWKIYHVDSGTTPETVVAAWDRILSSNPKPDGILTSGNPVSIYQRELTQAKNENIPVVDWSSANPPNTPGIILDINPVKDNQVRGQLLADYAVTKTNGNAKTLFLDIPDYPTLLAEQKEYSAETAAVCPKCRVDVQNFAATDIGSKIPSAVVSYLQQHPDINYITLAFDDMGTGVAEALKAAGLDKKVTIIGQSNNPTTAQSIATGGLQVATIPQGVGQMAYKALDGIARFYTGGDLSADKANLLPIWIQTKATIGNPADLWKGPAGYQQEFAKLWKVNS